MRLLLKAAKNSKLFDKRFLEVLCKEINKNTKIIEFFPTAIVESKYGLRNAVIRSRYKDNQKKTICKLMLFENSKGELSVNVRKGFMVSFVHDIKVLHKFIKDLQRLL